MLCVFAEDAEDLALNADVGGGGVDGGHLRVGGLQADHAAFAVKALEGGIGAVDQGDDDLPFAGGAGALDQNIVARDDVLVAHGVSADLEGEDFAVADDVRERDALGGFNGLDGLAGSDATQSRAGDRRLFCRCGAGERRWSGCDCGRAAAGPCSEDW